MFYVPISICMIAQIEINYYYYYYIIFTVMLQLHRVAMEKLEGLLKEKTRDSKRQRENFDMLKSANDTLHKEVLSCDKTQH